MIDLPGLSWHVFSTHDVPWRFVKKCLERNAIIADRTFVWANNPVEKDTIAGLADHEDVDGLLVTRGPNRGLDIYDVPNLVGEFMRKGRIGIEEERPDWVMFHDDDDTYPRAEGFPEYLAEWIESPSQVMVMRQVYLWEHEGVMRIDPFRTIGWHARYAKVPREGITWNNPVRTRCRPNVDEADPWSCPWPLIHYTTFNRAMRQRYHDRNDQRNGGGAKGGPEDRRYWVEDPDAVLLRADPELKVDSYPAMLRAVDAGELPEGSWKNGDGSWLKDFKA